MIGVHHVTVTPPEGGAAVDITCLIDVVSIVHGRTDTDGQPDASVTTIDLSFDSGEVVYPAAVDIGAKITVTTTVGAVTSTRFVGEVSDISVGWDAEGAETPNAVVAQILAVGQLAEVGHTVVGTTTPYPQELDGARVARVLAEAGATTGVIDPGYSQIIPHDVDGGKSGLEAAQETASSAGGILWQTRAGLIAYADADHRRGAVPVLTLDSCDVLVTPTWLRDTAGLVNGVSIGYGTSSDTVFHDSRPDSAARYGRYEVAKTTVLAALADAQALGNLILTRNAYPIWNLTDLPIDIAGLPEAATVEVLSLEMHDLIGLTGMPAVSTLPTSTSLWVEGWTEELTASTHAFGLRVSGYCRTAPPPRWDDVASSLTWDTVDPRMTWDSAVCMGPLPSEGRWTDVPVSLRWDQVAATVTWDTWNL